MTATPETRGSDPGRRRRYIALAVVVVGLLVVAGLIVAWLYFFGSEAPAAPTLDNAIKVLLPSSSPE